MTQVSKFQLRPELWERIFNLFIETLADLKNERELKGFLNNFLSPTERIMLAKRLAAAVMVAKGNDYRTISRVLRISFPTISKMSFRIKYEGEGIIPVIEKIFKKDRDKIIWEEIKDLLDLPSKQIFSSERIRRRSNRREKINRLKGSI